MDRLNLLPETSSITISRPGRGARGFLDGPAGRYGRSAAKGIFQVKCEWRLSDAEYKQWLDFYNAHLGLPFVCLLRIERLVWDDYRCVFDGKFKASLVGISYTIICSIVAENI